MLVVELPIASAIKFLGGIVIARRHHNCLEELYKYGGNKQLIVVQGFWTNTGRFVDRAQAFKLMQDANIPSVDPDGYRGKVLYSEDLY